MFKKLRNRFIMLNMVIISVMMLAAFAVIYIMTYTNIQNENNAKLQKVSATYTVGKQAILPNTMIGGQAVNGAIPIDYSLSFNVIIDRDGRPVSVHSFVDMPKGMYIKAAELALATGKEAANISLDGKRWMFQINEVGNLAMRGFEDNGSGKVVQLINCSKISFLDITESQGILTQLYITFAVIGFLMLFVIFGISVFFAKRSVAPVELAYMKQKQFVTDASHELKTPIASIGANTDVLLANKQETIESQKKWVEYIKAETDRMGKLVGDLLYLAKTDNIEIGMDNLPFNISDTVRDTVLSMEAVVYEKGLMLTQHIESNIIINGDSDKLAQVVKILIDNAIKYSNESGGIDIVLEQTRHQVVFTIKNTGAGISSEQLPKLFDRFYRTDPSRTHDGSYGLGLSIAKAIIDNIGGKIYATSVEGESTTFVFLLNK